MSTAIAAHDVRELAAWQRARMLGATGLPFIEWLWAQWEQEGGR